MMLFSLVLILVKLHPAHFMVSSSIKDSFECILSANSCRSCPPQCCHCSARPSARPARRWRTNIGNCSDSLSPCGQASTPKRTPQSGSAVCSRAYADPSSEEGIWASLNVLEEWAGRSSWSAHATWTEVVGMWRSAECLAQHFSCPKNHTRPHGELCSLLSISEERLSLIKFNDIFWYQELFHSLLSFFLLSNEEKGCLWWIEPQQWSNMNYIHWGCSS